MIRSILFALIVGFAATAPTVRAQIPPAAEAMKICDGMFERLLKGYWIGRGELDHLLEDDGARENCRKSLKLESAEHQFVAAFILERQPNPDPSQASLLYGEACGWHLAIACFYGARYESRTGQLQIGPPSLARVMALEDRSLPAVKTWLGMVLVDGDGGIPRDRNLGLKLLGEAADQGDYWASLYRALQPFNRDNNKWDKDWLRRAADQGNAAARLLLAHALTMDGDWQTGAATMRQTAETNPKFFRAAIGEARFWMGYYYGEGLGVPRDDNETTRWYRAAAELGNQLALQKLNPRR
jgi:TPR repeat protein